MIISRKKGKAHAAMAVCFGADRVEHGRSLCRVEGWNSQNGLREMKVLLDDVVHADGNR
jgi:hypothetical protein